MGERRTHYRLVIALQRRKSCVFSLLLFFVTLFAGSLSSPSIWAEDEVAIPCEVMETSQAKLTSFSNEVAIHYALIHHRDARERPALSKCLKKQTAHEVSFCYEGRKCRAILFRLDHCFGRGLLIYFDEVRLKKGAIIRLECPALE